MSGILDSLTRLGTDALGLVPALAVVLALVVLNRALTRATRRAVGSRFRNQLVMAGAALLGLLVVVVLLPVDAELRGQLLTLLGILFSVTISLSSSTFLGNAMAGIMLKSVRNFHTGDFIQVEGHIGRVTERGLFHTEIQTPSRDLTTLPNLYLATTPVSVVRPSGTIVDATVSLGYDVPHERVETLLVQAAAAAELAEPFVQVLELGDFSVTYRVAGLLEDTGRLLTFRSRLRAAMLDALHRGGVEIVSPRFQNVRTYDPRHDFVPAAPAPAPAVRAEAAPEVVFDKAEEAQSLADMRKRLAALQEQAAAAKEQLKTAPDDDARARARRALEALERRLAGLSDLIAAAEAREKAADD